MKIHKNISRKAKIIYSIILAIVILAIAAVIYLYVTHNNSSGDNPDNHKVNTSPATKEQIKAGEDVKQKTVENDQNPKKPDTSDSTTQQLSVSITAANQNGTTVSIRSLIEGAVSQNGTCTLKITNGSKSITKTATTQALANASTCQGFDIQVGELGAGNWSILLNVAIEGSSNSTSTALSVQ